MHFPARSCSHTSSTKCQRPLKFHDSKQNYRPAIVRRPNDTPVTTKWHNCQNSHCDDKRTWHRHKKEIAIWYDALLDCDRRWRVSVNYRRENRIREKNMPVSNLEPFDFTSINRSISSVIACGRISKNNWISILSYDSILLKWLLEWMKSDSFSRSSPCKIYTTVIYSKEHSIIKVILKGSRFYEQIY